jgi:hypothetical protein
MPSMPPSAVRPSARSTAWLGAVFIDTIRSEWNDVRVTGIAEID